MWYGEKGGLFESDDMQFWYGQYNQTRIRDVRELRTDVLAEPAKKAAIVQDRLKDKRDDAKDEFDDWYENRITNPYNRKKEEINEKIEDAQYKFMKFQKKYMS